MELVYLNYVVKDFIEDPLCDIPTSDHQKWYFPQNLSEIPSTQPPPH